MSTFHWLYPLEVGTISKEIKNKPDDSGIKAKQYLEGLLKIPFNNYKEEPVLKIAKNKNKNFINLIIL